MSTAPPTFDSRPILPKETSEGALTAPAPRYHDAGGIASMGSSACLFGSDAEAPAGSAAPVELVHELVQLLHDRLQLFQPRLAFLPKCLVRGERRPDIADGITGRRRQR